MRRFLKNNGLSLAVFALFLVTFVLGQISTGLRTCNADRAEENLPALTLGEYLTSAHFIEATGENWESEFLQMFVYIWITTFLFQKGSAESNDPDAPTPEVVVTARSPWPVRKGGIWRAVYSHSLSGAFALLFVVSFWIHLCGSERLQNEHNLARGQPSITLREHLGSARFWFESFQNWQSEFLSIGAMVVLSIFLREKGSPESKALEAPHSRTGE